MQMDQNEPPSLHVTKISRAVYSYEKKAPDELTFSAGSLILEVRWAVGANTEVQILQNEEDDDPNWPLCVAVDPRNPPDQATFAMDVLPRGFAPKTYFNEVTSNDPESFSVRTLYSYSARGPEEISFKNGDVLAGFVELGEYTLVRRDGSCGIVPSAYLEKLGAPCHPVSPVAISKSPNVVTANKGNEIISPCVDPKLESDDSVKKRETEEIKKHDSPSMSENPEISELKASSLLAQTELKHQDVTLLRLPSLPAMPSMPSPPSLPARPTPLANVDDNILQPSAKESEERELTMKVEVQNKQETEKSMFSPPEIPPSPPAELLETAARLAMLGKPVTPVTPVTPRRALASPVRASSETGGISNELRTWTDRTGTHKTEASLCALSKNNHRVILRKKNGVRVSVPTSTLCDEDREYVAKVTGIPASSWAPHEPPELPTSYNGFNWLQYLSQDCEIPQETARTYAQRLAREHFDLSLLDMVTRDVLKNLGFAEGDIQRVMRRAVNNSQNQKPSPTETVPVLPIAASSSLLQHVTEAKKEETHVPLPTAKQEKELDRAAQDKLFASKLDEYFASKSTGAAVAPIPDPAMSAFNEEAKRIKSKQIEEDEKLARELQKMELASTPVEEIAPLRRENTKPKSNETKVTQAEKLRVTENPTAVQKVIQIGAPENAARTQQESAVLAEYQKSIQVNASLIQQLQNQNITNQQQQKQLQMLEYQTQVLIQQQKQLQEQQRQEKLKWEQESARRQLAETERLKILAEEKARAELEKRVLAEQKARAEHEKRVLAEQKARAEHEKRLLEEQKARTEQEKRKLEIEKLEREREIKERQEQQKAEFELLQKIQQQKSASRPIYFQPPQVQTQISQFPQSQAQFQHQQLILHQQRQQQQQQMNQRDMMMPTPPPRAQWQHATLQNPFGLANVPETALMQQSTNAVQLVNSTSQNQNNVPGMRSMSMQYNNSGPFPNVGNILGSMQQQIPPQHQYFQQSVFPMVQSTASGYQSPGPVTLQNNTFAKAGATTMTTTTTTRSTTCLPVQGAYNNSGMFQQIPVTNQTVPQQQPMYLTRNQSMPDLSSLAAIANTNINHLQFNQQNQQNQQQQQQQQEYLMRQLMLQKAQNQKQPLQQTATQPLQPQQPYQQQWRQ